MSQTSKKKPFNKKILIIIAIVLIGGIAIKKFIFPGKFLFAGTLEATKVDLSARIASAIGTIYVQEGDKVTANQTLVELSCDDVKVAARLANETFERTSKLYKAGSASKQTMDEIGNHKEDLDVKLNWCTIQSPIQGTVLSRYHEPGEWVTPGTKILTLANIQDIWAYIYVPQPEIARLKPGMALVGLVPELKQRFTGKILKINDEAEFTPKNVQTRSERTRLVYGVKVSFLAANAQELLKPGMTIEVEMPKE